jgi:ABC-type lipoprotein export system ATPase subunit
MRFRITRIKLINNLKLFKGIGVREFELDIPKDHMVLLVGDNGCGKSGILEALSFLPRENKQAPAPIIPGEGGSTEIEITNGTITYVLKYDYTPLGKSHKIKAFILKKNGDELESLNDGSISLFYEFVKDAFNMWDKTNQLVYLTDTKKNIIHMTPTERKQFLFDNMPDMKRFKDAYDISSEKCKSYKRSISSLKHKISQYGSLDELEIQYKAILKDRKLLVDNLDKLHIKIGGLEGKHLKSSDELETEIDGNVKSLDSINRVKAHFIDGSEPTDSLPMIYNTLRVRYDELNDEYNDFTNLLNTVDFNLLNEVSNANVSEERIQEFANYDVTKYTSELEAIDIRLKKASKSKLKISSSELIRLQKVCIDINHNAMSMGNLESFKDFKLDILVSDIDLNEMRYDAQLQHGEIVKLQTKMYEKFTLASKADKLADRPKTCEIDDCPFIAEFIKYATFFDEAKLIEVEVSKLETAHNKQLEEINRIEGHKRLKVFYNNIEREILDNIDLINSVPITKRFFSKAFDVIDPYKKIDIDAIAEIDRLISEVTILENREADITRKAEIEKIIAHGDNIIKLKHKEEVKLANSKKAITQYQKKKEKLTELKKKTLTKRNAMNSRKSLLESLQTEEFYSYSLAKLKEKKLYLEKRNKTLSKELDSIVNHEKLVTEVKSAIKLNKGALVDMDDREKLLSFQITDYKKMSEDLVNINRLLHYGELIRASSSPKSGAPMNNIRLVTHKLKAITNKLLEQSSSLYRIEEYVVRDDDFEIKVLNENGEVNDAIDTLSGGELALVATAQSMALIYTLMPEIGFIKLDEVDGALYGTKKTQFMNIIETSGFQTFMVSHNDALNSITGKVLFIDFDKANKTIITRVR